MFFSPLITLHTKWCNSRSVGRTDDALEHTAILLYTYTYPTIMAYFIIDIDIDIACYHSTIRKVQ